MYVVDVRVMEQGVRFAGQGEGAWCKVRGVWSRRGARCMVQGARCMVHGAWCVVRGAWCVVHGAWCVVRGAWCMMRGETVTSQRNVGGAEKGHKKVSGHSQMKTKQGTLTSLSERS
jgi:hypothetical protein